MFRHYLLILFIGLLPAVSNTLYWKQVSGKHDHPLGLYLLPKQSNGKDQFLVLEQRGKIILTDFDQTNITVLDWSDRVKQFGNELGFLGIALSPNFSKTGRAYFNLTNKKKTTEIWRYTFDPNNLTIQKKPAEKLLTIKQPYGNHNGGWLEFGPDGMLYIATGDGGAANDPKNYSQDLTSLLGKILRINVSGKTGYSIPSDNPFVSDLNSRDEIYAYGLRNPWRCHWHDNTLIIADVGQNHWEEVNVISKDKLKGANFGWRLREGNIPTPNKKAGGERPKDVIEPALVYPHDAGEEIGGLSITGGILYKGAVKRLRGKYIFADFVLPRIWCATLTKSNKLTSPSLLGPSVAPNTGEISKISSFGEGTNGELYLVCLNGNIYKLSEHP